MYRSVKPSLIITFHEVLMIASILASIKLALHALQSRDRFITLRIDLEQVCNISCTCLA